MPPLRPSDHVIPPPNQKVANAEDLFQKGLTSSETFGIAGLKLDSKFPYRPGYGTKGRKVLLWTNYFEMIPHPKLTLHRYHVDVKPDATGKKLSQIIRLLLELPGYAEYRDDLVTDFKSTLICRRDLGLNAAEWAIPYRAEGEDEPRSGAQTYQIRVEVTGTLAVSQLTDYLASTNVSEAYADKLPVLQALNIFLGHYAKSNPTLTAVGSNKTFSLSSNSPSWDLGAGLSALRGFFSSVRVATCRMLVNVNVSHGAFYEPIPLDRLIQKYGSANQFNRIKLQTFLKGVRVKVTHLAERKNKSGESIPRVKTIFGLANKNDGHGLDHPPRVASFGAGPKEVEFFLNESSGEPSTPSTGQAAGTQASKKKGKGKKAGAPSGGPHPSAQGGRYISVYDFFRTGMCPHSVIRYLPW